MNPGPPEPLYLVGPTASGKSALAMELALRLDGEIVNADAFQLYSGMPICTAQPSPADLARVTHHLFGVISPDEKMDAQRYSELARPVIAAIAARKKTAIIVGGSGLYVKSLTHGLLPLPTSHMLREKLGHLTLNERLAWLSHRDPHASSTVDLHNDRYVTRALEICLLTGQPQSELRKAWSQSRPHFRGLRLVWNRDDLDARINQRVLRMVQSGLIAEIAALPRLSPTAEMAIGVREVRAHLAGTLTLQQTIAAIQLATRQYARRQDKWFKREHGFKILPVSPGEPPPALAGRALAILASP